MNRAVDSERERIAELLPNYELGDEVGRGSFGVVFAARHRQLGREVAVKRLRPGVGTEEEAQRRFRSEARVLAGLDHPHIVRVYDFVDANGLMLLVMEWVAGGTLRARIRGTGVDQLDACAITLAACAGLQHAHEHGILHRDIKPDNLLFDAAGVVKLADFGIAKVLGEAAGTATGSGVVLGTPQYLAPEQVAGGPITPATDVFATGTVLYQLLTGKLPYPEVDTPLVALYQRVHQQPRPITAVAPATPDAVAAVVTRALDTDSERRFETAGTLARALLDAAAEAWGEDWLSRARFPIRGLDELRERRTDLGRGAADQTVVRAAAFDAPTAPASPPAPRRRRRGVLIAALGVALAALVGGIVAAVSGGGGGAPAAPAGVAQRWVAAYNTGDYPRAASYFAPGARFNGRVLGNQASIAQSLASYLCALRITSFVAHGAQVTIGAANISTRIHPCAGYLGTTDLITLRVLHGRITSFSLR